MFRLGKDSFQSAFVSRTCGRAIEGVFVSSAGGKAIQGLFVTRVVRKAVISSVCAQVGRLQIRVLLS